MELSSLVSFLNSSSCSSSKFRSSSGSSTSLKRSFIILCAAIAACLFGLREHKRHTGIRFFKCVLSRINSFLHLGHIAAFPSKKSLCLYVGQYGARHLKYILYLSLRFLIFTSLRVMFFSSFIIYPDLAKGTMTPLFHNEIFLNCFYALDSLRSTTVKGH